MTNQLTLKQAAESFEADFMYHICDLPEFSVNLELRSREKKNQAGEAYTQFYVELNKKKYQVPPKVLELMQQALKLKPTITRFKATKSGSGLGTKYKLEALD